MGYKVTFRPNEALFADGRWRASSGDRGLRQLAAESRIRRMSLQAEPARPHDLPGALDLLGRSGLPETEVAQRWGHFFVVREDDGRVVGVAGLEVHAEHGLLRSVAVDPDYRGQGARGRRWSTPCWPGRACSSCATCTC